MKVQIEHLPRKLVQSMSQREHLQPFMPPFIIGGAELFELRSSVTDERALDVSSKYIEHPTAD
jgi:hypothetical protein